MSQKHKIALTGFVSRRGIEPRDALPPSGGSYLRAFDSCAGTEKTELLLTDEEKPQSRQGRKFEKNVININTLNVFALSCAGVLTDWPNKVKAA